MALKHVFASSLHAVLLLWCEIHSSVQWNTIYTFPHACGLWQHCLHKVDRVVISHSSMLPWLCMWLGVMRVWFQYLDWVKMQILSFLSEAFTKKSTLRCSKTSVLCFKKVRSLFRGLCLNELWRFSRKSRYCHVIRLENGCFTIAVTKRLCHTCREVFFCGMKMGMVSQLNSLDSPCGQKLRKIPI